MRLLGVKKVSAKPCHQSVTHCNNIHVFACADQKHILQFVMALCIVLLLLTYNNFAKLRLQNGTFILLIYLVHIEVGICIFNWNSIMEYRYKMFAG